MLCLSCVAQQSNVNRTGSHNLGTRNFTWCDERIRQYLLCHYLCRCTRKRQTVRIVKGVTVLPKGVARSSRAPSSDTWFLSTFLADEMITNDTDTQRKQWKSSCQTSTNLLNTCLVTKLTEYLLEDAQNQGSMGQNEGLRER